MPLEKGKAAFGHNVKAELAAGKPRAQALAIAYREAGDGPLLPLDGPVSGFGTDIHRSSLPAIVSISDMRKKFGG